MSAFTASPTALRLFVASIVARLPLAMLTIGVLVHVKALTESFAAAGVVAGTLAVAQGIGGPLLGRAVDRRGQTGVLVASAVVSGVALAGIAAVPGDAPLVALLGLAAVLGFATPPVPACMRALLPSVVGDPDALRSAYAVESAAVELTWISGPPLVLLCGTLWSTGVALLFAGALIVAATLAFAATTESRAWRPVGSTDAGARQPVGSAGGSAGDGGANAGVQQLVGSAGGSAGDGGANAGVQQLVRSAGASAGDAGRQRPAGGALRSPGVRTLALVLAGAGLLFGATEVAVAAAAEELGSTSAAGPLLGLWGLGGFLGGLAATRAGGGARTGAGLAGLLAALAAAHAALGAAGSLPALGAGMVLAGAFIAPTCATVYAMVDHAAPEATVTEAFAWMATAVAVGTSAGAAAAGALAESAGPAPTFVLAGAAAAAVAVLAALRAGTLESEPALLPVTA